MIPRRRVAWRSLAFSFRLRFSAVLSTSLFWDGTFPSWASVTWNIFCLNIDNELSYHGHDIGKGDLLLPWVDVLLGYFAWDLPAVERILIRERMFSGQSLSVTFCSPFTRLSSIGSEFSSISSNSTSGFSEKEEVNRAHLKHFQEVY